MNPDKGPEKVGAVSEKDRFDSIIKYMDEAIASFQALGYHERYKKEYKIYASNVQTLRTITSNILKLKAKSEMIPEEEKSLSSDLRVFDDLLKEQGEIFSFLMGR